jgi:peroxiredoxin Q/BCP
MNVSMRYEKESKLAERVGFEPTKDVNPCWFSRPVHSAALPPLRILNRSKCDHSEQDANYSIIEKNRYKNVKKNYFFNIFLSMGFYLHSETLKYAIHSFLEYLLMSLEVGQKVPDFSLKGDDGKTFKLSGIKDKVLLVFYPGDGTPVCTTQWNEYKDNAKDFDSVNVEVIGISSNDSASHKSFKKEHNLPFKLLSDADGEVAKTFDCLGWFGVKRGVFLVSKDLDLKYSHIESVSIFKRTAKDLVDAVKKPS